MRAGAATSHAQGRTEPTQLHQQGRCGAQAYLALTGAKGISAAESFCNSHSPSLASSLLLSSWGGQQHSALMPHWSQSF